MNKQSTILHATTVSIGNKGAVFIGASGAGKSGLALEMMALGAQLIADDRTELCHWDGADEVIARAPKGLPSLIEARGIGLLNAPLAGSVRVAVVVDLDETEGQRMPELRDTLLLGRYIPLLHRPATPHFAASLYHYLMFGRKD
ncbi:HPr kinase/phosphorylase [Primorskyibacter flagellatus]|nr:hypothetical protein [Primorskyibacter flagellatus]